MKYKGKKLNSYKKSELIKIIDILRSYIPCESDVQRRFEEWIVIDVLSDVQQLKLRHSDNVGDVKPKMFWRGMKNEKQDRLTVW